MSKKDIMGWIKSIVIAIGIAIIVRTFLFSPYIVEGISMEPTLHNHERLFVNIAAIKMGEVKRGDIVIIKGENLNYVKRVIGLPGDVIEMRNDHLIVNGITLQEPYLAENKKAADSKGWPLTEDFGPLTVPSGEYFVMGDNRQRSMDSRNGLGLIKEESLIGKSEFVIFPLKKARATD
ncbi:MAG TPA: signal peptidase I [Bacillaceae bacterium]